jgi:hypothetical protein
MPFLPILSQINPFNGLLLYFFKVSLLLFPYLYLYLTHGLFPSGFPTKTLNALLFFFIRATRPAYLILLDLVVLLVAHGHAYKLCSFLPSSGFFFLVDTYVYIYIYIYIYMSSSAPVSEDTRPTLLP